ncbi:MAG: class I SAM-dependent methyltransferase [Deltaproteobacteria bacterium]|nr:class I SAM-dependent methyltransferase [Deltaproteobacteria bacterium]
MFLRERHHMFLRRASPGKLLDIGCGEGGFLEVARGRGFEVAGLDLDPGNVEAARRRQLDVQATHLVDERGEIAPTLARGGYDWVTAFDVLEHQANPIEFLEAARSLLRRGGTMCGSVPNRERLLVHRDRAHNRGDLPPHHFLWFSQRALETTLRNAGFAHIRVSPIPERDPVAFAAYIEIAMIGRPGRGTHGKARPPAVPRTSRVLVRRLASTIKNLPFVPLAVAVNALARTKVRNLFFEAS